MDIAVWECSHNPNSRLLFQQQYFLQIINTGGKRLFTKHINAMTRCKPDHLNMIHILRTNKYNVRMLLKQQILIAEDWYCIPSLQFMQTLRILVEDTKEIHSLITSKTLYIRLSMYMSYAQHSYANFKHPSSSYRYKHPRSVETPIARKERIFDCLAEVLGK
ncbi:hypothetical protein SDC9_170237 [bioreactor metagenome]|uniref:Uncharacterized protein n=1 Tax=bioreactor metagenome TaxID=1076179 RepID=A0A645GA52_9ZZZZ